MPRVLAPLLERNGPLMHSPRAVAEYEHTVTREQRELCSTHLLDRFASGTRVVDRAVVFVDQHELTATQ